MKNNLEPRAKIGDVVLFMKKGGLIENEIIMSVVQYAVLWEQKDWVYSDKRLQITHSFTDKDILKNLTTNVSYENN